MNSNNWLAGIFDWLGDALERFNPSAFRFLAALLPYLTPIPVAWLTAHSASNFLHFTPQVSFVFVFALEGIGLWFTTMLVDSIVDWVRSKNWKAFVPVLMFGITVGAYVLILVNLNVTLEQASGNINPALSQVITLMCFLPLITGVGNGYYKLKLETKTDSERARERQDKLDAQIRAENNSIKIQKFQIKYGSSKNTNGNSETTSESNYGTSRTSKRTSGSRNGTSKIGRPSIHEERVFSYMDEQYKLRGEVPSFTEVAQTLNLSQSTASRLRNQWMNK